MGDDEEDDFDFDVDALVQKHQDLAQGGTQLTHSPLRTTLASGPPPLSAYPAPRSTAPAPPAAPVAATSAISSHVQQAGQGHSAQSTAPGVQQQDVAGGARNQPGGNGNMSWQHQRGVQNSGAGPAPAAGSRQSQGGYPGPHNGPGAGSRGGSHSGATGPSGAWPGQGQPSALQQHQQRPPIPTQQQQAGKARNLGQQLAQGAAAAAGPGSSSAVYGTSHGMGPMATAGFVTGAYGPSNAAPGGLFRQQQGTAPAPSGAPPTTSAASGNAGSGATGGGGGAAATATAAAAARPPLLAGLIADDEEDDATAKPPGGGGGGGGGSGGGAGTAPGPLPGRTGSGALTGAAGPGAVGFSAAAPGMGPTAAAGMPQGRASPPGAPPAAAAGGPPPGTVTFGGGGPGPAGPGVHGAHGVAMGVGGGGHVGYGSGPGPGGGDPAAHAATMEMYRQQIARLREQLDSTTRERDTSKKQVDNLMSVQRELQHAQQEKQQFQSQASSLQKRQKEERERAEKAERALVEARARAAELEGELHRARAAHAGSRSSPQQHGAAGGPGPAGAGTGPGTAAKRRNPAESSPLPHHLSHQPHQHHHHQQQQQQQQHHNQQLRALFQPDAAAPPPPPPATVNLAPGGSMHTAPGPPMPAPTVVQRVLAGGGDVGPAASEVTTASGGAADAATATATGAAPTAPTGAPAPSAAAVAGAAAAAQQPATAAAVAAGPQQQQQQRPAPPPAVLLAALQGVHAARLPLWQRLWCTCGEALSRLLLLQSEQRDPGLQAPGHTGVIGGTSGMGMGSGSYTGVAGSRPASCRVSNNGAGAQDGGSGSGGVGLGAEGPGARVGAGCPGGSAGSGGGPEGAAVAGVRLDGVREQLRALAAGQGDGTALLHGLLAFLQEVAAGPGRPDQGNRNGSGNGAAAKAAPLGSGVLAGISSSRPLTPDELASLRGAVGSCLQLLAGLLQHSPACRTAVGLGGETPTVTCTAPASGQALGMQFPGVGGAEGAAKGPGAARELRRQHLRAHLGLAGGGGGGTEGGGGGASATDVTVQTARSGLLAVVGGLSCLGHSSHGDLGSGSTGVAATATLVQLLLRLSELYGAAGAVASGPAAGGSGYGAAAGDVLSCAAEAVGALAAALPALAGREVLLPVLQRPGQLLTPLLQRHRPAGPSSGCRTGMAPAAAAVQLLQALLETPACRRCLAGALGAAEAYPASPSPPGAGGGPAAMDTDDAVRHGTSMDAGEAQQLAAALLDCLDLDTDEAGAEEGMDGVGDAAGGVGDSSSGGVGGGAGGGGRCTAAEDGAYGSGGGWGPYEVPRRVLALLAGSLEAGQEGLLAAMCHGGSWSSRYGLAQRLLELADFACAPPGGHAASPLDPVYPTPPSSSLQGVIGRTVSPARWLQRLRLAEEALLLLKELLTTGEDTPRAALDDLTCSDDAAQMVELATMRLCEWPRAPPELLRSCTSHQALAAAGLRPVTLAPWAGRLALVAATGKSNAMAAAAAAAAGAGAAAAAAGAGAAAGGAGAGAAGTGLGVGAAGGVEASVVVVGALSNSVRWRWQRWWQQQKMMQMPVG